MLMSVRYVTIASAVAIDLGFTLEDLQNEVGWTQTSSRARREIAVRLRQEGASYREIGAVLKRDTRAAWQLAKPKHFPKLRVA